MRKQGVGIYAGNQLIHVGALPKYIHELLDSLFSWLQSSILHPLVKSCVFHYEFEFIHPFSDGNGRIGRLWHTLILQNWKPFFAWLPIETLIKDKQQEYYAALNHANTSGESTIFVVFMLHIIKDTLRQLSVVQSSSNVGVNVGVNPSSQQKLLLTLLQESPHMTSGELAQQMGLSKRQVERIIADVKASGKIERIGAPKNGYWKIL